MRIEHFSDEHGIYVRAPYEAFLVSKEEAASIRKYIDELRELCWCLFEWERVGGTSRDWRELQDCARELGIEVDA